MTEHAETLWMPLHAIVTLSWKERKRLERELEANGWSDPSEWYDMVDGRRFLNVRKRVLRTPDNERMMMLCVLAGG